LIGIVLLIGIVKKNAHHDDRLCAGSGAQAGSPPVEAIYQACLLRFRPIMMTTMAALLGGVPLALGSAAWVPSCAGRWESPCRRTDFQSGADSLHHAGDLSFFDRWPGASRTGKCPQKMGSGPEPDKRHSCGAGVHAEPAPARPGSLHGR
jgi:hypothetical protein